MALGSRAAPRALLARAGLIVLNQKLFGQFKGMCAFSKFRAVSIPGGFAVQQYVVRFTRGQTPRRMNELS